MDLATLTAARLVTLASLNSRLPTVDIFHKGLANPFPRHQSRA